MLRLIARLLFWHAAVTESRAKGLTAYVDAYEANMRARGQANPTASHVASGLSILGAVWIAVYLTGGL